MALKVGPPALAVLATGCTAGEAVQGVFGPPEPVREVAPVAVGSDLRATCIDGKLRASLFEDTAHSPRADAAARAIGPLVARQCDQPARLTDPLIRSLVSQVASPGLGVSGEAPRQPLAVADQVTHLQRSEGLKLAQQLAELPSEDARVALLETTVAPDAAQGRSDEVRAAAPPLLVKQHWHPRLTDTVVRTLLADVGWPNHGLGDDALSADEAEALAERIEALSDEEYDELVERLRAAPDADARVTALRLVTREVAPRLDRMLQDVRQLSGAEATGAGVVIPERSTPANRDATRDFLLQRLEELSLPAKLDPYPGGANVFTRIESTNGSARTLVVGAHFDSVPGSPGANDNATGVAVALDVARAVSQLAERSHDVVVVFYDQEEPEQGPLGSRAHAQALLDSGTQVSQVHTLDMLGWDADGDRLVELDTRSPQLLAPYQRPAERLGIPLSHVDYGYTDFVEYAAVGLPAVGVGEEYVGGDTTPHYHGASDTAGTVDPGYLQSSATLVETALTGLVASGERPGTAP